MRVITIGREYGSGGGPIAEILGTRLKWKVIDDPLVAYLARSLRVNPETVRAREESVEPWSHRLLKALWRGGFVGSATRTESEALDADAIAALWHRVIREAAEIGNCITVGRGGQCLLQDRSDTFHVYVYAPLEERIERLRGREPPGTDLRTAALDRDARRAAYVRHYFDCRWTDPHLYHLMLCSSIGLDRAAETILRAAGLAGSGQ
ncbi:MAG TPA: cytidylate kinase-like family protein [Bryobacteraceae bacterium]|nr:cytidylate kinase-like family protein [Bryobacteraceae bacterium]